MTGSAVGWWWYTYRNSPNKKEEIKKEEIKKEETKKD